MAERRETEGGGGEGREAGERHVLIAGCGYVGSALAERLVATGARVWTLRRSEVALPGCKALQADLCDVATLSGALCALPAARPIEVVYLVSAGGFDPAAYRRAYVQGVRNLLAALAAREVVRFVYASSTAVYGDAAGGWVDETTPARPTAFSGDILLQGEGLVAGARAQHCLLRLGGIYGPGRTSLINRLRRGEAIAPAKGPRYRNRIHRDDAAAMVHHVLDMAAPRSVYNVVDDEPAPLAAVQAWLCEQLGIDEATLNRSGRRDRRPSSNKRCSNRRLHTSGFELSYPSFREGYASLAAS